MKMKRFLIPFILATALIVGLMGFQYLGAATYTQPLYSTTQSTNYDKDAANRHNGGMVYYVDGNKVTAGDGLSWANAYNTLTAAMAASHANIALSANRAWAVRNVIYVRGDELVEDFTKLAQKTDIIGVGSNSAYSKAGITGSWIIPDTVNYMGCRFYNIMFTDAGATAIFDLDTQSGIEFHDCLFDSGDTTTIAIQMEESNFIKIVNCEFSRVSATKGFSASAIKVVDDTNAIYGIVIEGNKIQTAGIGIDWDETEAYNVWITGNNIYAAGLPIDDQSATICVTNNFLISDTDLDTSATYTDHMTEKLAAGNYVSGSGTEWDTFPFLQVAD